LRKLARRTYLLAALIGLACFFAQPRQAADAAGALTILPVNIRLQPGQTATALTIINNDDAATSFQIRAFKWTQDGNGQDQLQPTTALLVSPPLGTIPAGATQTVRMVLSRLPNSYEDTYRILIDQLPPPGSPNVVQVVLRFSIPVFASPEIRAAPDIQWQVLEEDGQAFLIATNNGTSHETIWHIKLSDSNAGFYALAANTSPYILRGSRHYWRIISSPPPIGATLRLTAATDTGNVTELIKVSGHP
jgi:fimbrial chaperone protein